MTRSLPELGMLFLLVSFPRALLLRNSKESSIRLLLSSSSAFFHSFCCLRNKNTKPAFVAVYWSIVMALRALAISRLRLAKLQAARQGSGSPAQNDTVGQSAWLYKEVFSLACSGCFHHQPSEMAVPVSMALAQLFPTSANAVSRVSSNSGNRHPHTQMIRQTLYSITYSCLMSALLERYIIFLGKSSHKFQGERLYLIPISTLVPSRSLESPFQALLLHLKAVAKQNSGHAAFLVDTHCHQQPFPGK